MVWDQGTYESDVPDAAKALRAGELPFHLRGKKLRGGWVLIRTRGRQWLLIKRKDAAASKTVDITATKPRSVVSRRVWRGRPLPRPGGARQPASRTAPP